MSDETAALQATVAMFKNKLEHLQEKIDNVGGGGDENEQFVQILEQAGSSSPILVHKLLKELPQQDKEVKLDR